MSRAYYTLVSSLPYLPFFEQASGLPINPERLQERLRMLHPDDHVRVDEAQQFVAWQHVAYHETDERIIEVADQLPTGLTALDEIIGFRADLRTIIAALRRRKMGKPAPEHNEAWGIGGYVDHIRRNWEDPDFRLLHVYPWISEVRRLLERGETVALEKAILTAAWEDLNRLVFGREFGLEAVLVYLFKWDIIKRWLVYTSDVACGKLEEHVLQFNGQISQLTPSGAA